MFALILLLIIGFILVLHMLRQLSYHKTFLFKNNRILAKERLAVTLGIIGVVLLLIVVFSFR